jgi:hypothetical protein
MKPWLIVVRKACGLALAVAAMGALAHAGDPMPAPEIDPGSMMGAAMLLSGGLLMLADRRKK